MSAEKLISLFTILLFNNRYFSLTELTESDKVDASKPSVSRLIRQLERSSLGNIRRMKKGKEIYFKLEKPKHMPAMSINAEGLRQLALCRELLVNFLPQSMHEDMRRTIGQASCYLPEGSSEISNGIAATFYKGHVNYEPFQETIETLTQAIIDKKICFIRYKSAYGGEEKERYFAPKRLLAYHECLYCQGYFVNEDGAIKYENSAKLAIHRMPVCAMTEISSENVAAPPDVDNGCFGLIEGETFTACIKFNVEAAQYVGEREWSANQHIERHEDGSITLIVQMNNVYECVSWIMSFGDKAEVLQPDWLREEIAGIAANMSAIYQKISFK